MRNAQKIWVCLLAAALVAGCAKSEEESGTPAAETQAAAPAAALGTAKVTGTVDFTGPVPPPERSAVKSFSECAIHHQGDVFTEDVMVNNGKLQNVFVYVKEGLTAGRFPLKSSFAVLDQKGCIYAPHVLGVQAGQEVHIKNSDVALHNVHSHSTANKEFNVGMPVQGMVIKKKLESPEVMVKLTCDVHPWMKSYIGVVGHPFFAVSDGEGNFSLEGLPAGSYTVEAWHERFGAQTQTVTVSDGQAQTASFTFSG